MPNAKYLNPVITFKENIGFPNLYRHLRSCFARGLAVSEQERTINKMLNDARCISRKEAVTIHSHFTASSVSDFDKQAFSYIKLVVHKHLPLSLIEASEFRSLSKYNVPVSIERFTSILFPLVELLAEKVKIEMLNTKSAIIYDGWSRNDMHFTAFIASYCT